MATNSMGEHVPPHREILHYHGDSVRVMLVLAAFLIIVAKSTGADIPLSTTGAVVSAVVLVIAAGVTNPAQRGIHWVNGLLAVAGTLLFGTAVVEHYRAGISIFNSSFIYDELLTLLSLVALYLSTRTIRGLHLRSE